MPSDPVANLMYYLRSVNSCMELDDENIARLGDYANYSLLDDEERQNLLELAKKQPVVPRNKVFLARDGMRAVTFSTITDDSLAGSIEIRGQTRKVKSVMAYKDSWMDENYC